MSKNPLERPARVTQGHVGRRLAWRLALPLAVIAGMMTTGAVSAAPPPAQPDFGPNVMIFDPSMSTSAIKTLSTRSRLSRSPTSSVPGATRCCSSPAPTARPPMPLNFQVGYYTDVAGLGASPTDVVINGTIDVYNQCVGRQLHRARTTSGARCRT